MISTCPSCLSQVDHEDHLFEVVCTCGAHFNPYYNQDMAPMDLGNVAAAKESSPPIEPQFEESDQTFQEIREFGEALTKGESPEISIKPPPKTTSPSGGDSLMVAGDHIEGFSIDRYLTPLSVACEVSASDNPLQKGFELLWEQAQRTGANGVVGLRWVLSANESKVFLSGTPVQTRKNG